MMKLVSVIIPVYNAASYLNDCLVSVLKQTYNNLEVIIINDGSTDNSVDTIKSYVEKDKRFKIFNQPNKGLGYTRNRGVKLSKGEYLFFLDADDIIPEDAISMLAKAIETNNSSFATGKVVRFNSKRRYIPPRHLEYSLYKNSMLTNITQSPQLLQDSIACNKLWKKSFIEENKLTFLEGKLYEDLNFTLKAYVLANKIEVLDKIVYFWRVREDENKSSITQNQMELKNTLDRLNALLLNRDWLVKQKIESKVINENDKKSLLDVLRLHVSKYALVDEKDKLLWLREITVFLKCFPKEIIDKLPDKERLLYKLVVEKREFDLLLVSQALTNSETKKIVQQQNEKLILHESTEQIEITQFLKPIITISECKNINDGWLFFGELEVPKVSAKITGKVIIKDRRSGEILDLLPINTFNYSTSLYEYEKQN
ncbi:glycosyltransferase, partial [Virgibacillus halodenitrificans]|nr:glycosyltransferase [Virgibacillus halodenitrificans]